MNGDACPHCDFPTTPDNVFPVADGSAYHILCYQAACLAAGQPDPFPPCDRCGGPIWEFNAAGEKDMVVRGSVCDGEDGEGEPHWRSARFHPVCAPSEADLDADAEPEPAPLPDPAPPEPELPADLPSEPAPEAQPEQRYDAQSGKPICPMCERTVQRQPFVLLGTIYHRQCGARQHARNVGGVKRATQWVPRLPRCPHCKKRVVNDPKGMEPGDPKSKRVETMPVENDQGVWVKEVYHKMCYRRAIIAGGGEDPFPPRSPQATKAMLDEGKAKRRKERAEAKLVCGMCNLPVLRSEYPAHIMPCAEAERLKAAAAERGEFPDA